MQDKTGASIINEMKEELSMTERMFDPDTPALDQSVLQEFVDAVGPSAPEMLGKIVGVFLEETPPLLAELAAAVRDTNHAQVVSIAHRLRGSCMSLGAYAMAGRCAILEECLPREAAALSLAVSVEYRRTSVALRAFLESVD
jgi:HPt (histidine-containing phosphotransfer) domain-containing protein